MTAAHRGGTYASQPAETHLKPYAEAARTWLHAEAEVIDTTHLTPAQAAAQIVLRATGEAQGPDPERPDGVDEALCPVRSRSQG
ncbi:hypothetical protein GCM10012279_44960 [Micromonospora yangpuensis]|uniref:Uncharacterized protein n=1 Tax=Micromonospora yangpuensis TaxID=683228 RepID=A0A1C6TZW7_9ACTN|nr:hypothetical protein GCM10012279_44960 [Micromonospora yangpuensis]SCL47324.1 hypothetical protein GA0070617_0545 [Micromonospora yangpuensis]